MEITIRTPKVTAIRRFWKWGLLALLALAITLTSGRQGAPVEAGIVGPQINITKVDSVSGDLLAGACFQVLTTEQVPLFYVCDNDIQGVDWSPYCGPTDLCTDEDPAKGSIRVTVAPGNYSVLESKAPVNHNPDLSKQPCNAVAASKCDLTFENTAKTMPWFPWDVDGNGEVVISDIVAVISHYGQSKH